MVSLVSISGFIMMLSASVCLTDLHCLPFFFSANPSGKEFTCQAGDMGSIPGLGRSPRRGSWQLTLLFLAGESPWTEELVGYSPWGPLPSEYQQGCSNSISGI